MPDAKAIACACGRICRRTLPIAIVATIAFGVGGAAWAGYRFVTTSPRFAIEHISVTGNTHVSTREIEAALPVHVGDNAFGADLDRARVSLLANPWIETAKVDRELPHGLTIAIAERAPVAIAELGSLYLVDDSGHPFKRAAIERGEGADLPIITGLDRETYRAAPDAVATTIHQALAALTAWRASAARPAIGELHLDASGGLVLRTLDHGAAISLGPITDDFTARIETFDAAWSDLSAYERDRATAIRLDIRTDHVSIAFAKN